MMDFHFIHPCLNYMKNHLPNYLLALHFLNINQFQVNELYKNPPILAWLIALIRLLFTLLALVWALASRTLFLILFGG